MRKYLAVLALALTACLPNRFMVKNACTGSAAIIHDGEGRLMNARLTWQDPSTPMALNVYAYDQIWVIADLYSARTNKYWGSTRHLVYVPQHNTGPITLSGPQQIEPWLFSYPETNAAPEACRE